MPALAGTTNRVRVVVVHAETHTPVFDIAVIGGQWSADLPPGQPWLVIYISPDCPPEIHGPYST